MTPHENPFRPTFGVPPLFWVGRTAVLDTFRAALDSRPGTPGRSLIISGARGIGKTVLLNELEDIASSRGWITLRASGRSSMVEELVDTTIPRPRPRPPSERSHHRLVLNNEDETRGLEVVDECRNWA